MPLGNFGGAATATTTAVDANMGLSSVVPAARSVHRFGGDYSMGPAPPSKAPALYDDDCASTWWPDVLSPTDEEMGVLSKMFGIQP